MGFLVSAALAVGSKLLSKGKKSKSSGSAPSFPSLVDAGNARPKSSDLFRNTINSLAEGGPTAVDREINKEIRKITGRKGTKNA